MLSSITIILLCQLIGEIIAKLFSLPVPGPVIGMVLIMGILAFKERYSPLFPSFAHQGLEDTSYKLLKFLPLMFVPTTVGIIDKGDILKTHGVAIIIALMLSTLLTLLLCVWVFALVARWAGTEGDHH